MTPLLPEQKQLRGVRRTWPAIAALGASILLGGCSVGSIGSTVIENRQALTAAVQRPFLVNEARNIYLLQSGSVFYPDGQSITPAQLPTLSDAQVDLIGSIMTVELERIRKTQAAHAALLAREFPGHDATRVPLVLQTTRTGSASAGSVPQTGTITIDARVIQGIYRAAVIWVFDGKDEGDGSAEAMSSREFRAFHLFDDYRLRLADLRSVTLGDNVTGAGLALRAVTGGQAAQDRAFAQADALFARSFEEAGTMIASRQLERAFLGAIRFMLAHEAGHVALAHPIAAASCEEALANEATADRYAILVSDLADYDRIPGIVLARGSTQWSWHQLTPLDQQVLDPSDGSQQFFGFAYDLAGFDLRLGTAADCSYPAPAQRLAAVAPLANAIHAVHQRAVRDQALRRFGSSAARRGLGTAPFDEVFSYLPETATEERTYPADLQTLRTLLSEVYYDTYNRPN